LESKLTAPAEILINGVDSDAPKLSAKDLQQWKLITEFRTRLEIQAHGQPRHRSWEERKRRLQQFDYLSLFLFALVNPAVKTLRAICAASHVQRVQQEVCTHAVSLGSFSEAQHLIEPQLLEELIASNEFFQQLRLNQMLSFGKTPQTDRMCADFLLHSLHVAGRTDGPQRLDCRIDQREQKQAQVIKLLQPSFALFPRAMPRLAMGLNLQSGAKLGNQFPLLEVLRTQFGRVAVHAINQDFRRRS